MKLTLRYNLLLVFTGMVWNCVHPKYLGRREPKNSIGFYQSPFLINEKIRSEF